MLLGLVLLYVGAVLFLNGLWLLQKIDDKEIWVINVFSGLVTLFAGIWIIIGASSIADIKTAALIFLFSFTYLWVAINRFLEVDGRGLGWFSLFVAITIAPITVQAFLDATNTMTNWLAFSWLSWTILWFMFFLLLGLKKNISKLTGYATFFIGIFSAWIPGFLILNEAL